MRGTTLLVLTTLALVARPGRAQTTDAIAVTDAARGAGWKVVGRTASVVDAKGKHALRLSEGPGMGVAWLDGYDFANGTIEVDLLGRSRPVQGSFLGVAFRVVDATTHDAVYFRPFNFRAPDSTAHAHAVQYVSHPGWPWNRLRAQRPGAYEAAVVPAPDGDEWFHVRIVVEHPRVSVFVNGAAQPSLVVNELSDRTHGKLGLWVGEGSGGQFANLRVTRAP